MLYSDCILYRSSDKENKTPVKKINLYNVRPLDVTGDFGIGNTYDEGAYLQALTATEFDYKAGMYNLIIPTLGDFKITGYSKTLMNLGKWKKKYKFTLTLQG